MLVKDEQSFFENIEPKTVFFDLWSSRPGSVSSSVSGAGPSVKHYFRITFLRRNFNTLIINDLYFAR